MDDYLFVRNCSLEAQLELERKAKWEMQKLVEEAVELVFEAGLTAERTDWYLRANRALGKENKQ